MASAVRTHLASAPGVDGNTTHPLLASQKAEVIDRRDLTLKVSNQWICGTAA